MKTLTIFVFFPFFLVSMEPMVVDQKKNTRSTTSVCPIPLDICAKIATIKSMQNPIHACCQRSLPWRTHSTEVQVYSKSWLPTTTVENLLDKQMWVAKVEDGSIFRFDNDTTNDRNRFVVKIDNLFGAAFDGPNNDGDTKDTVEGCAKGVIALGLCSKKTDGQIDTVLHLFKQHGTSAQEYTGIQKKEMIDFGHPYILRYEGFPHTSNPLVGHTVYMTVIASGNKVAMATKDVAHTKYLHVYDYTYEKNDTDKEKPDQSFTTSIVATLEGGPKFKRLAWLYGKTLIGLSKEHELYTLAVDEKSSTVICYKQKMEKRFKDFALGRPYNHHEMVLVDEQNALYYVNLKYHGGALGRAFVYKKILDAKLRGGSNRKLRKTEQNKQQYTLSLSDVDRIWIYNDLVGLKQKESAGPLQPDNGTHNLEDYFVNFLSLHQRIVTATDVAVKVARLIAPPQKEIKLTSSKRRKK